MNKRGIALAISLLAGNVGFTQPAKDAKPSGHVLVNPGQIQWQPAGPSLPAGAQLAVLDGDPAKAAAMYAVALKMPSGYKIPPHFHPMDAGVVVVKGTFMMGLGEKVIESKAHELPIGTYMRLSKGVRHFEWTKSETILYIYGQGPLDTIYVNPADDPRKK
jgi:ChrR-like protein with cupin domain